MKKVCLINGSLRGKKASSLAFLKRVSAALGTNGFQIHLLTVKPGANGLEALTAAASADVIVIAFPLFCYTLPGALTRFLEDLHSYAEKNGQCNGHGKVFAIVNCGFPEPRINEEAIRVMRSFCARLGLRSDARYRSRREYHGIRSSVFEDRQGRHGHLYRQGPGS